MRILVFCSDDIFAGIVGYKLITQKHDSIVAMFIQRGIMPPKSIIHLFRKIKNKSGYCYALYQGLELVFYRLASYFRTTIGINKGPEQELTLPSKLAYRYSIPVFYVDDVMSKENLQTIRDLQPDLIVCLRFSQILRGELLNLPKYGVINFHASLLPQYAGLGSIFQVLYYGETYAGGTVHFMNEKIDEGNILVQEQVPVSLGDSVSRLSLRCYCLGADLVIRAVDKLARGSIEAFNQRNREHSYFSWPEKHKVKEFKKRGKKFLKISDIWNILFHFSISELCSKNINEPTH